jgi:hypothetical protein
MLPNAFPHSMVLFKRESIPEVIMYSLIFSKIELEKHTKTVGTFAERSHVSQYGTD